VNRNKLNVLAGLQRQVASRDAFLVAKQEALANKLNLLKRGQMPMAGMGNGASQGGGIADPSSNPPGTPLQANMQRNLPPGMVPGNVGDINRVIWPFYFTTDFGAVPPNSSFRTGFTITQEAAFIWMSFTKAIYIQDDVSGDMSYIDPDQPGDTGCAYNLSMTIRDSSSERDFENSPFDTDMVGNPRWPTKYPRPSLFAPNGNVEITFTNSDPALTYVPFVTAFGYRIRIEDARTMLSFVTA
jgi:hypothetical protein